jgi:hypothetical protein
MKILCSVKNEGFVRLDKMKIFVQRDKMKIFVQRDKMKILFSVV